MDYQLGYTGKNQNTLFLLWVEHSDDIMEIDKFVNIDYKLHQTNPGS